MSNSTIKAGSAIAQKNKMQIIIAAPGAYMETLRRYAGTTTAVLPFGIDWTPVIEAEDPLEAVINLPLSRCAPCTHVPKQ